MNENFSFKMGMKFAALLDMGENFLDKIYCMRLCKKCWK